jgi:hypothetical protein
MYFLRNSEFGSALSKLRNFGGDLNLPPNPTFGMPLFRFYTQHNLLFLSIMPPRVNWPIEGNTPHGKATVIMEADKEFVNLIFC